MLCYLFFLFNIVKKNLLYWFFYYKVSVWKLPINVKGERKHPLIFPLHGSRCCKKKIYIYISMYIEDGTVEQLQPEARCIVQHSGFKETSEGWLSLSLFFFFFCLQNIIMYTAFPWFSFSLFYILLFSVHIINVNAAKSGTVSWHVLIGFLSQAVGLFTINECE